MKHFQDSTSEEVEKSKPVTQLYTSTIDVSIKKIKI